MPGARNNDQVSRIDIHVVLGIFGQVVRRQLKLNLLTGISAMLDGDNAACLLGESSRRGDQVEEPALANRRVSSGATDLSHHRDSLRGRFVHENGNVRATDKASVLQPLLDQFLRFVSRQVGNVNIVNQRQVDVSGTGDARLGREIGHSEHSDLDQIADAQLHIGIGQQTRRLGRSGLARRCGLRRVRRGRCLGQKVEAARTDYKHVQASQKETAIPPGHTKTPGFTRASSLTHANSVKSAQSALFRSPIAMETKPIKCAGRVLRVRCHFLLGALTYRQNSRLFAKVLCQPLDLPCLPPLFHVVYPSARYGSNYMGARSVHAPAIRGRFGGPHDRRNQETLDGILRTGCHRARPRQAHCASRRNQSPSARARAREGESHPWEQSPFHFRRRLDSRCQLNLTHS